MNTTESSPSSPAVEEFTIPPTDGVNGSPRLSAEEIQEKSNEQTSIQGVESQQSQVQNHAKYHKDQEDLKKLGGAENLDNHVRDSQDSQEIKLQKQNDAEAQEESKGRKDFKNDHHDIQYSNEGESQQLEAQGDAEAEVEDVYPVTTTSTTTTAFSPSITPRMSTSSTMTLKSVAPSMAASLSTTSGNVFMINALEKLGSAKEAKRNKKLKDAVTVALDAVKNQETVSSPETTKMLLRPFKIAIESQSSALMVTALDGLGKLISYNYPLTSLEPAQTPDDPYAVGANATMDPLIDLICDCFLGESTNDAVQLQIIKALLAAVLSNTQPIHQHYLLKAVRTIYNIFLLSRSSANQTIAQATLTQMVHQVFSRIRVRAPKKERPVSSMTAGTMVSEDGRSAPIPVDGLDEETLKKIVEEAKAAGNEELTAEPEGSVEQENTQFVDGAFDGDINSTAEKVNGDGSGILSDLTNSSEVNLTLKSFENRKSIDVTPLAPSHSIASSFDNEQDMYIKDAFLIFRALCKLSMKPLNTDGALDPRSYTMRSKLLSLHLILTILNSHMAVFTSPHVFITSSRPSQTSEAPPQITQTPFIQAVKQYLCLSLSRNCLSVVMPVFELSLEIFWKCITGLRQLMKKEIEVFFGEIFFPILESRNTVALGQKYALLGFMKRICSDPQVLVEIYLNYDCDREAGGDVYEKLVNILSKITTQLVVKDESFGATLLNPTLQQSAPLASPTQSGTSQSVSIPPSLTTHSVAGSDRISGNVPTDLSIKIRALECLVAVMMSLITWYTKGAIPGESDELVPSDGRRSRGSEDIESRNSPNSSSVSVSNGIGASERAVDDPEQFGNLKQKKQLLREGIRKFNFKPKKGIQFLIENNFIKANDSENIAKFLLTTDGLSKAMIGEYLGEAEPENIATMHSFVNQMDFTNTRFTDALRHFLQTFRLPGEAQKIDRFMLKFAERYVNGNPTAFANADTAYILAYSVIMLNTDLHNPQIKRRMTQAEFIKNNRGINDNADLPEEFLVSIYEEILSNEIKMKDEQDTPGQQPVIGISSIQKALVSAGLAQDNRLDIVYQAQTEEFASKTEALLKNMRRASNSNTNYVYYSASHVEHVKPMFEVVAFAFVAGLSVPLQDTSEAEVVMLCLEGFRYAIKVACEFSMELERNAFVTTLAKFTYLSNLDEMKPKNVEAIKALLQMALEEGNLLKNSWRDVLTCVSSLERFQIISTGVDRTVVPDLINARRQPSQNGELNRRHSQTRRVGRGIHIVQYSEEVAGAAASQEVVLVVDRLFSSSVSLNGSAIVDFVKALCEVSWEEIVSSMNFEQPRMFSLTKSVEISYYNMNRIRMEWSHIWAILGDHFNQVGCQKNFKISFFALDSLRQLSMKFLEKEELPHFKFQKDFLMPFEYILAYNPDVAIKDMVLRCLSQMIQARAHHIKSGWKTMFAVFSKAARETQDSIVSMAFDIVRGLVNDHFEHIVSNGIFPDLITCLAEFSKNKRFQKTGLQALDLMRATIPKMIGISENGSVVINEVNASARAPLSHEDFAIRFWFAVLYGLKEVIMKGEDVEVRTRALNHLFDTLKEHGDTFSPEFWESISRQIVFPLFEDLRPNSDHRKYLNQEELSVWLSTTLIQALRNFVDLYSYHFELMENILEQVLELLAACITQDNDTLARIGCQCLQQYIEANVNKFNASSWDLVTSNIVKLFQITTATALFENTDRFTNYVKQKTARPNGTQDGTDPVSYVDSEPQESVQMVPDAEQQKEFQSIIVKCVLQLLLIQTVNELLNKQTVYAAYPAENLITIVRCLQKSFHNAQQFNNDTELRTALWKMGFMKQLPNLLKQETGSATCYVSIMWKMYGNSERIPDRVARQEEIGQLLIPLCSEVLDNYASLDVESKPRNINAWTPMVVSLLGGLTNLLEGEFEKHLPRFYPSAINLLAQDQILPEVRMALRGLLLRVGQVYKLGVE